MSAAVSDTIPSPVGREVISRCRRSCHSLAIMAILGGFLDYSIYSFSQQVLYTTNVSTAVRKAMAEVPYEHSVNRQEKLAYPSQNYATTDALTRPNHHHQQQQQKRSARTDEPYMPSSLEGYVFQHAEQLGLTSLDNPSACDMWRNATQYIKSRSIRPRVEGKERAPTVPDNMSQQFAMYFYELQMHTQLVDNFTLPDDVTSLVEALRSSSTTKTQYEICQMVNLHLDTSVFAKSQQLSRVPRSGWLEPLLPPLRHPEVCFDQPVRGVKNAKHLMDLTYLLHDWSTMCMQLTPYSRIVLIDMGASLAFHGKGGDRPAVFLTDLYQQFGLPFDHVYAYEITPQEPATVFAVLPEQWSAAYHWINVGVDPMVGAENNPFTMLKQHYGPDDLVVVKLDVDNSAVEMALVQQLLDDPELQALVDQFYFENHVHALELAKNWKTSMTGTVLDSMTLFSKLRQLGVASHSWV